MSDAQKRSFQDMLDYVHLYRLKTNYTEKQRTMIAKSAITKNVCYCLITYRNISLMK